MPGKTRVGMLGITPNRGFSFTTAARSGQKQAS